MRVRLPGMAAITTHIGQQDPEDMRADAEACEVERKSSLGAARACVPPLASTHNGLTKMLWIRRTLEDLLVGRQLNIVDGAALGKRSAKERSKLYFVIDPPYTRDEISWMPAAPATMPYVALIGEAGKMACPTWDLPAGAMVTGGTCPGAQAGQSTVPLQIRKKAEVAIAAPINIRTSTCQLCYALGGQYASPHVQAGEIIRHWWCREMMKTAQSREIFVNTVVRAIQGEMFPTERVIDQRTGKPIIPFRIHSSGDFFSHEYAAAWIEICNQTPQVMYWAPTRTWAYPGWVNAWKSLVKNIKYGNLAIRPSSYHTDDPAPSPHDIPWTESNAYPFTSAGTTAIYKFNDKGEGKDPRYDHACRTYAIVDEAHTCQKAMAPDGKIGCRACWIRPDLRIDYAAH